MAGWSTNSGRKLKGEQKGQWNSTELQAVKGTQIKSQVLMSDTIRCLAEDFPRSRINRYPDGQQMRYCTVKALWAYTWSNAWSEETTAWKKKSATEISRVLFSLLCLTLLRNDNVFLFFKRPQWLYNTPFLANEFIFVSCTLSLVMRQFALERRSQ